MPMRSLAVLLALAAVATAASPQCPDGVISINDAVLLSTNCSSRTEPKTFKVSTDCKKDGPLKPFVKDWECADAITAASGINIILKTLDITSVEIAALGISQMMGESGCFRMSHNHWGPLCTGDTGCEKGFLGKGTFSMFPATTLAMYMLSEGVFTSEQLAAMSSEQALQYIMGPTNIHAYGPEFWFLDPTHAQILNAKTCTGDWIGEVKKGNLEPWRACVYGSTPIPADAVDPNKWFPAISKAIVSHIQTDSCKFTATPSVALGYPSGVPAFNKGTVSFPSTSLPQASGSQITTTPTIVPYTGGAKVAKASISSPFQNKAKSTARSSGSEPASKSGGNEKASSTPRPTSAEPDASSKAGLGNIMNPGSSDAAKLRHQESLLSSVLLVCGVVLLL